MDQITLRLIQPGAPPQYIDIKRLGGEKHRPAFVVCNDKVYEYVMPDTEQKGRFLYCICATKILVTRRKVK